MPRQLSAKGFKKTQSNFRLKAKSLETNVARTNAYSPTVRRTNLVNQPRSASMTASTFQNGQATNLLAQPHQRPAFPDAKLQYPYPTIQEYPCSTRNHSDFLVSIPRHNVRPIESSPDPMQKVHGNTETSPEAFARCPL